MALGLIQPLTEMNTRNISLGKGGRCVRLTLPFHVPIVLKSGSLKLLEPSGPVQACNGIALPLNQSLETLMVLFQMTRLTAVARRYR
jgi:hypothetical protein